MKNLLKSLFGSPKITRLSTNLRRTLNDLQRRFSSKITTIVVVNLGLILFQFFYLRLRFEFLSTEIPFWYSKLWGDSQLAPKEYLYLLPVISAVILVIGLLLIVPLKRYYVRHAISVIATIVFFVNVMLTYSVLRIIFLASTPFEPIINPLYFDLLVPAVFGFFLITFILPRFIDWANNHDLVTNPNMHKHPGMLLKEPSARGGGFVYGVGFIILAVIFIGLPAKFLPFYLALLLLSVLGYMDDYQNTHPESKLRALENPFLRLFLLFLIVSIVSALGTQIFAVSNPSGGTLEINSNIASLVLTTLWIVWVLNVFSWSNGIDGQYAGIVGIASFFIVLLALRFEVAGILDRQVAIMAAISAGLSLGFIRYTWHPSKIMWGFGSMTAGLVLSVLSILISSKIITSIIIILIPFLDAVVTVLRRVLQGKNPLKGDRGHLHHILLSRGWSIRRIVAFYWFSTALFGYLALSTVDNVDAQLGLIVAGVVAFILVVLNISFSRSNGVLNEDSKS